MAIKPHTYRSHPRAGTPRQRHDRDRGTANQRGYTYRWQQVARAHLRDNPLCVDCLADGRSVPATDVDHIIPHRGDDTLFWDPLNRASRCHPHHSSKTARGE